MSPFLWRQYPRDSIFAGDTAFTVNAVGKTRSETSSTAASQAVKKRLEETGRNPGSIEGLGRSKRLAGIKPTRY
jgi:hypothetical protein